MQRHNRIHITLHATSELPCDSHFRHDPFFQRFTQTRLHSCLQLFHGTHHVSPTTSNSNNKYFNAHYISPNTNINKLLLRISHLLEPDHVHRRQQLLQLRLQFHQQLFRRFRLHFPHMHLTETRIRIIQIHSRFSRIYHCDIRQ